MYGLLKLLRKGFRQWICIIIVWHDLYDHHIATMYDPNESDDIEVYIWIVDETFNSLAYADA